MLRRIFKWIRRNILLLTTLSLLIVLLPRLITGIYMTNRIYNEGESPPERVAIIFGAGLRRDGTPTAMLPRALFLCNTFGLDTVGVDASNYYWNGSPFVWDLREQFATIAAFLDLYVTNPSPVLGDPEPLFGD